MGLFRSTLRVFSDVTSLGGTYRVRKWRQQQLRLLEIHSAICRQIDSANQELIRAIAAIDATARVATRHLRTAARILDPYEQLSDNPKKPIRSKSIVQKPVSGLGKVHTPIKDDLMPLLVGTASGGASAAGAWGIVQVIGHASTGTAMGIIHGAAASNAGWAWFGGGSLAVGGGGMAAGHLVLPGVGTAVAVAVSSTIAHKQANRLADQCEEITAANEKNSAALDKLHSDLALTECLSKRLDDEEQVLRGAVVSAQTRLFPYGAFSRWRRLIRVFFGGYYYKGEEFDALKGLNDAVERFLSAFDHFGDSPVRGELS